MKRIFKSNLPKYLSRKFVVTVWLSNFIFIVCLILFILNNNLIYNDNGQIIGRTPILSETGFVEIVKYILLFVGGYIAINTGLHIGQAIVNNHNNKEENGDGE